MRARILGSAAGGGFPQWNCGCPNCAGLRAGRLRARPRTQDSVAIAGGSGDDARRDWFLLNCSPDIHRQIHEAPCLHPRGARDSPIAGIVLTNGDLDHVLGLFSLRESQPLVLYGTERVLSGLAERNTIFRTLRRFPEQLSMRPVELGRPIALTRSDGTDSGLVLTAWPAPGKLPVHLMGQLPPSPEDNVGITVRDARNGDCLVYATAVAGVDAALCSHLDGADTLLFDGTFHRDDELVRLGLSTSRASDMAHVPMSDDHGGGSLTGLSSVRAGRRIFTHINNTNPVLDEGSQERRAVEAAGWEIAFDGLELGA